MKAKADVMAPDSLMKTPNAATNAHVQPDHHDSSHTPTHPQLMKTSSHTLHTVTDSSNDDGHSPNHEKPTSSSHKTNKTTAHAPPPPPTHAATTHYEATTTPTHDNARVFWEQGYEGASLADLTEAMGISRTSMYAAFGNKEELFRKALDRYTEGRPPTRAALTEPTALAWPPPS